MRLQDCEKDQNSMKSQFYYVFDEKNGSSKINVVLK